MFNGKEIIGAEYQRTMRLHQEMIEALYSQNLKLQEECQTAIARLPRGSIVSKNVKGYEYFYFAYRDQGKVVTKYISVKGNNIPMLHWDVRKRRLLEKALRSLKKDQAVLERHLRLAGSDLTPTVI